LKYPTDINNLNLTRLIISAPTFE